MSDSFVNAYVDGSQLVLLTRETDGRLTSRRVPAEYSMFIKSADLPPELERQLRASSRVRGISRDGDFTRILWSDSFVRYEMCFGKKVRENGEVKTIPSPFQALAITIYEGDVDPVRRFMTDTGSLVQPPRRCFLDIEADSRNPFSRKTEGRVLSWSVAVLEGGKRREVSRAVLAEDTDEDECKLLLAMWRVLEAYDQINAWNGDGYDFEMVTKRSDVVRVRVDPRRWLWLDQLVLFKKMNTAAESGDEKQSMALANVGASLALGGKEEIPDWIEALIGKGRSLGSATWELWSAGGRYREFMLTYNSRDTDLQAAIEEKTGYAALFDTVCAVCRVFPNSQGLNNTQQVDGLLLYLGKQQGHRFATKIYRSEIEQFAGAYVMHPRMCGPGKNWSVEQAKKWRETEGAKVGMRNGIAHDVHVGDFKSLYPAIIITWNMSPETKSKTAPLNGPILDGHCRAPSTGISFDVRKKGLLVEALQQMLQLRKFWNDKKKTFSPGTPDWKEADRLSTAYKVLANAFFGVIGSPFSRYYDREIGESITQNGKWLLMQTISAAEDRGMVVCYCDTDSIFVMGCSRTEFEKFVEWCNAEFYPELLKRFGCTENLINLAYEKQFDRIIFTGAKRYAGRYVHYGGKAANNPGTSTYDETKPASKPEIKGLEYKRGDTALLARRMQEEIINHALSGQESKDFYEVLIREKLDYVLNNETLPIEHVRMTTQLTKSIKEYVTRMKKDGAPCADLAHVRVAKILKERGRDVAAGTRIEYIISDGSTSPAEVIPAEDYDGTNADRFHLWETEVWPASQRFLAAAFPDVAWDRFDKVRPPKPKAPKKLKGVLEGQLALGGFDNEPMKNALPNLKEAALNELAIEIWSSAIASIEG